MKPFKKIAQKTCDALLFASLVVGAHKLIPPPYNPSKHTLEQTITEQLPSTSPQNLPSYISQKQEPAPTQTSASTPVYVSPEQQLSLYETLSPQALAQSQEKVFSLLEDLFTNGALTNDTSTYTERKRHFFLSIGPGLIDAYKQTHDPKLASLLGTIAHDTDPLVRTEFANRLYALAHDNILQAAPTYRDGLNGQKVDLQKLQPVALDSYLFLAFAPEMHDAHTDSLREEARAFIQGYAEISAKNPTMSNPGACNMGGYVSLDFSGFKPLKPGVRFEDKLNGMDLELPHIRSTEELPRCTFTVSYSGTNTD